MVEQARAAYPHYNFRGLMRCTLCLAAELPSPGPIWSQENVFVPSADLIYVAPGGIVHYVEAHCYLPPRAFVEAALHCPDLRSAEYRQALRIANQDVEPPLESADSFKQKIAEMLQIRKR